MGAGAILAGLLTAVNELYLYNDWIDGYGKTVCEDLRCLAFGVLDDARFIDHDVTLKATTGPVKIGHTKEGTIGIRVAGTMKVDANKKLNPKWGGKIVNSNGLSDRNAWGKRAAWVDYHGPVDDKVVGVAIMNHPGSFRTRRINDNLSGKKLSRCW